MITLAEDIAQSGARRVFGIPGGGTSLSVIDALEKSGIQFSLGYHEASCAIIAAVYGAISHTPAITFSIKGPGVANLVPGLAAMKFEDLPVVAISESVSRSSLQRSIHKKMSHFHLTREVVKARMTLHEASNPFQDAWQCAITESPGPVLIDLVSANEDVDDAGSPPTLGDQTKTSQEVAQDITAAIRNSARPILILGSACARMAYPIRLQDLQIPIFTTLAAKGVFDEDSIFAGGIYTGVGLESAPETKILEQCDLVVGLCLRGKELLGYPDPKKRVINLDVGMSDVIPTIETVLIPDIQDIGVYIDELERKSWGAEEVGRAISDMRKILLSDNFLPAAIFKLIEEELPESRLVSDTGLFCTVAEHLWKARTHRSFMCASNGRYMGTALPMGIGASLADRSRPTIIAVGDGGIGMYVADLRIAVEQRLPILVLLLTDGGYGSVQAATRGKGINLNLVTFQSDSWKKVLAALGLYGELATDFVTVSAFLNTWNWRSGPAFLECRLDPEPYRKMIDGLR